MKTTDTDRKPKRKSSIDLSTMVYGKVPPQERQVEEAVLGICLIVPHAIDVVEETLKPECFYVEANQKIFRAMQTLNNAGINLDYLTVVNELRRTEEIDLVGGPYYITKLTDKVNSMVGLRHYCEVVLQTFIKRELIRIGGEIIGLAYEDATNAYEALESHEKAITAISTGNIEKQYTTLDQELVTRIHRIEDLRKKESHITGVPSDFRDIDALTHGWQPTDLIILAARPSVGKTAFALNLARAAARHKKPVAFFSLEMSKGQLIDRLLAAEASINLSQINNGNLSEAEMVQLYQNGITPLSQAPIFIDDTPALNVYQLRRKARALKRKDKIELIILDYLQLMTGDNPKSREQEISKISRELKALAKELEIPIIALSQLSREVEKRKSQTPILADLRESGAIEQDADAVFFLYRPEYHDQNHDAMGDSTKGDTYVSIAKHRNGKIATGRDAIKLRAELQYQKFHTTDPVPQELKETGGSWKPVPTQTQQLKIQIGSKLNNHDLPEDDGNPF